MKQLINIEYIYTLTQIPQPIHNSSDIVQTFEVGNTSMHSLPLKINISKVRNTEVNQKIYTT
jgi:hypothetical protein